MKINYKKIASVLASTVMLGSTVAFASAAFPAPFVNNGVEDAALVIGATAAESDNLAAIDLGASLDKSITATTGGVISGEGDKIKLEKGANKVTLVGGATNSNLSYVWGTSITKSDLPTLLADNVFNNKQNSEYKYEQTFKLGDMVLSHFADSNYNDRLPTLGFNLGANTVIANYTLGFITYPESAVSTSDQSLTDLETKTIKILGKEYYILDFKNGSAGKITLLDSATTSSLTEDEKKTLTVGDKTYEVAIKFITDNQVILTVNGVDTEKLSSDGVSFGNTYKLADGTFVGIKTINVQNYAGGSKSVDFSLGKGKLEINGAGGSVKINDKSINDLTADIAFGTSGTKTTWQKLSIVWKLSDQSFLTAGKELVMPGFEAIKFLMEDTTMPMQEMTQVIPSSDYVNLKTTIKDGDITIPLLYVDSTTGNFSGIGQSATQRIATSTTNTLIYNANSTSTFQNQGFVVSYAGTRDSESYYMQVTNVRNNTDVNQITADIKNKLTGDTWTDKKAGDTITLGNVVLTVSSASYDAATQAKSATLTVNAGGNFTTLYTKAGLKIVLPWEQTTGLNATTPGALNLKAGTNGTFLNDGSHMGLFNLIMTESDKDGTVANGNSITVAVDSTSSGSTQYVTISDVTGDGTAYETPTSGSKVWVSYVASDLATKLTHDKTDTNQYSAKVEYHGGQVYANVYLAAPSVTTTGGAAKVKVVKDSEVDSVKSKNLIVVGGSCINTVAATLLGSSTPLCGADFTAKTQAGVGQYLIQTSASPYNTAKIAMLVAGYDAAETTAAVAKVKDGSADSTVGKSMVGPTAS